MLLLIYAQFILKAYMKYWIWQDMWSYLMQFHKSRKEKYLCKLQIHWCNLQLHFLQKEIPQKKDEITYILFNLISVTSISENAFQLFG